MKPHKTDITSINLLHKEIQFWKDHYQYSLQKYSYATSLLEMLNEVFMWITAKEGRSKNVAVMYSGEKRRDTRGVSEGYFNEVNTLNILHSALYSFTPQMLEGYRRMQEYFASLKDFIISINRDNIQSLILNDKTAELEKIFSELYAKGKLSPVHLGVFIKIMHTMYAKTAVKFVQEGRNNPFTNDYGGTIQYDKILPQNFLPIALGSSRMCGIQSLLYSIDAVKYRIFKGIFQKKMKSTYDIMIKERTKLFEYNSIENIPIEVKSALNLSSTLTSITTVQLVQALSLSKLIKPTYLEIESALRTRINENLNNEISEGIFELGINSAQAAAGHGVCIYHFKNEEGKTVIGFVDTAPPAIKFTSIFEDKFFEAVRERFNRLKLDNPAFTYHLYNYDIEEVFKSGVTISSRESNGEVVTRVVETRKIFDPIGITEDGRELISDMPSMLQHVPGLKKMNLLPLDNIRQNILFRSVDSEFIVTLPPVSPVQPYIEPGKNFFPIYKEPMKALNPDIGALNIPIPKDVLVPNNLSDFIRLGINQIPYKQAQEAQAEYQIKLREHFEDIIEAKYPTLPRPIRDEIIEGNLPRYVMEEVVNEILYFYPESFYKWNQERKSKREIFAIKCPEEEY